MKTIINWNEVPKFESEEDEAKFWAGAQLDTRPALEDHPTARPTASGSRD